MLDTLHDGIDQGSSVGQVPTDRPAEVVDQRTGGQRRGLGTIVLGTVGDLLQAIADRLAGHERSGEICPILVGAGGANTILQRQHRVGSPGQPVVPLGQQRSHLLGGRGRGH